MKKKHAILCGGTKRQALCITGKFYMRQKSQAYAKPHKAQKTNSDKIERRCLTFFTVQYLIGNSPS